jgi:hypothetical protein
MGTRGSLSLFYGTPDLTFAGAYLFTQMRQSCLQHGLRSISTL